MLVTKSTGEPRITITLTEDEARSLSTFVRECNTYGWPTVRELGKQLEKALTPEPACEVNIAGDLTNKCKRKATHRWKITCKNDHHRTRNYCDHHGRNRESVELLVCRPCKTDALGHVYCVGVAEVKL